MRMSPTAMGTLVVPAWNWLMNFSVPGMKYPTPTPIAIARNIQSVRNRSRNESLPVIFSAIESSISMSQRDDYTRAFCSCLIASITASAHLKKFRMQEIRRE